MIVVRDGDAVTSSKRSVVAIGVFDGLHRGHQAVIGEALSLARDHDASCVVATFDPHPAELLDPAGAPMLLATLAQRLEGLDALGVDVARVLTFDAARAAQGAEDFVGRELVAELRAIDVVVGEDFRFGHDRAGDVRLLERLGERHDFRVHALAPVGDGERFSSTGVRAALARGDVTEARRVLGRPFTLRGVVVRGDARGRELGFPTANLALAHRQALPGHAIYAALCRTGDGEVFAAATSVGTRPQFYDAAATLVEAHLVGYGADLYGSSIDLAFLERLRGESTFSSVNALAAQMAVDVEATERVAVLSGDPAALLGWTLGQRR
ncbi:MAG: bifunctional riboflavin kinase/FAD synthetase [Acidimicrobiales bacterium]